MARRNPPREYPEKIVLGGALGAGSWSLFLLAHVLMLWVIFNPSPREFAAYFLVDFLMILPAAWLAAKVVHRAEPASRIYYPVARVARFESIDSPTERSGIVESLVRVPRRIADHAMWISCLKVVPAFLIMVFYWRYDRAPSTQFFLVLGMFVFNLVFFWGLVYVESLERTTTLLQAIDRRFDWSEAFTNARVNLADGLSETRYILHLAAGGSAVLGYLALLYYTRSRDPSITLRNTAPVVFISAMLLYMWIQLRWNRYIFRGLNSVFRAIAGGQSRPVPLHSYPVLAHFEQTLNRNLDSVKDAETEMTAFILRETERARYQGIGEVAAGLAHEISTPLQALVLCTEHLADDPSRISNPRYLQILRKNIATCSELVSALRARMYRSIEDPNEDSATLSEIHQSAWRLLLTQYAPRFLEKIDVYVDPRAAQIRHGFDAEDLGHVLDHLYRSAFLAFETASPRSPQQLRIDVVKAATDGLAFDLSYSGEAMGPTEFDALTRLGLVLGLADATFTGLGLRLARRLIEQRGGTLAALANPRIAGGTTFRVAMRPRLSLSDSSRDPHRDLTP